MRELLGPVDRVVMRNRLKSLALLPSLAPVQILTKAVVELRQQSSANEAAIWQLSS